MDHRDFTETVSRPFHIQTRVATDAYRDGWERTFGQKRRRTPLRKDSASSTVPDSSKDLK